MPKPALKRTKRPVMTYSVCMDLEYIGYSILYIYMIYLKYEHADVTICQYH